MSNMVEERDDWQVILLICTISFAVSMLSLGVAVYLPPRLVTEGFSLRGVGGTLASATMLSSILIIIVGFFGDQRLGGKLFSSLVLLLVVGIAPLSLLGLTATQNAPSPIAYTSLFGLKAAIALIPYTLNVFLAQVVSDAQARVRLFLFSSVSATTGIVVCLVTISIIDAIRNFEIEALLLPALLLTISLPLLYVRVSKDAGQMPPDTPLGFLKHLKFDRPALVILTLGFATSLASWKSTGILNPKYESLNLSVGLLLFACGALYVARLTRKKKLSADTLLVTLAKLTAGMCAASLASLMFLGDTATLIADPVLFASASVFAVILLAQMGNLAEHKKRTTKLHSFAWYFLLFWTSQSLGTVLGNLIGDVGAPIDGHRNEFLGLLKLLTWLTIVMVLARTRPALATSNALRSADQSQHSA